MKLFIEIKKRKKEIDLSMYFFLRKNIKKRKKMEQMVWSYHSNTDKIKNKTNSLETRLQHCSSIVEIKSKINCMEISLQY